MWYQPKRGEVSETNFCLLLEREFLSEGKSKRLVQQEVLSRKNLRVTSVTLMYLDKKIKVDQL